MNRFTLAALAALLAAAPAAAEVGDPTVETDHPHYPGEGALQTVEQCVRRATAGKAGDQDRAVALYLWLLTHQYHAASPQEWLAPGRVPDNAKDDPELTVYDADRGRFSYGYGLCGTVHAWNEPYWRALGMPARRRAFPGHTNSEVFYGGSWHAFDTDMAGLVFRRDGAVAGYHDVRADPSLVDVERPPLPRYPFAWPGDFRVMKKGWAEVAKGGHWYKLYHGGYAAQPGVVRLRAGETFTRYFDRDHFGGPAGRRYWHAAAGGPARDWTFVNAGEPRHDGPRSNARGNASYSNGEFVYRPDLARDSYREGVVEQSATVTRAADSPRLRGRDGAAASVTFGHFSPYVIAGRPLDGRNPMAGPAAGGLVVAGAAVGDVRLSVSADQGQSWREVGPVRGRFEADLTDHVKGRYGWRLRFDWRGDAGLDELRFTTVTQAAQTIYPRLKPGGCAVTYRAASRAVMPVLPDFGAAETVAGRAEARELRSANLRYAGRGPDSRFGYVVGGPKPGTVVFRVEAPAPLLEVRAAARFNVRVPPPPGADYRLELSADGGATWQPLARAEVPADNEYSSAWVSGTRDVSAAKADRALVAVRLSGGGTPTGLIAAELYGVYRTGPPQALRLTHAWKEAGAVKTHREEIPAGAAEWAFRVPTGPEVADEFVRLECP